jgi:hypothetical protein
VIRGLSIAAAGHHDHSTDVREEAPVSDPMKQAWRDVEDGFSALGRMIRDRYQAPAESAAETTGRTGEAPDAGAALRDAFEQLVAAGRELGERATDVVRDDDIRAQAKRAAASLNDALAATVELIGEQVTGFFKRAPGDAPPEEPRAVPTSSPTDGDPQ